MGDAGEGEAEDGKVAGAQGPSRTPSAVRRWQAVSAGCSPPSLRLPAPPSPPPQMGPNAKELFRLVEDFVDVIGFRMKDLRDAYQVTDNLGKPTSGSVAPAQGPSHAGFQD